MLDQGTTTRELAISLLLVGLVVVPGAWFLRVQARTKRVGHSITPELTILVAFLTPAAIIAAGRLANDAAQLGAEHSHWLWHSLWVALALPVAIGLHRFRGEWRATGWTARSLAATDLLVRGVAAGNALAAIGAAFYQAPANTCASDALSAFLSCGLSWGLGFLVALVFHSSGESLAVGSLLILVLVCILMLGVGMRGALRPAVQPA